MSLDDWKLVFVFICSILIIFASAPVVMVYLQDVNTQQDEPFFDFAVLGEGGMAEHYYPDDDSNIGVGQKVNWVVSVYNHMGETKYVAVRVRILNSSMLTPNSTSCKPSYEPLVYEFRRVMSNNETWLIPFSWSILNMERVGDLMYVKRFYINDEVINRQVVALYGFNYRIVLELWVYDEKLEDFKFSWVYGDEMSCAWNQIWFNVTSP